MAVRVRLRIRGRSREVATSTLINSGFEAEEPQMIIPLSLAEALGMTSAEASIEDFSTAGGGRISVYRGEPRGGRAGFRRQTLLKPSPTSRYSPERQKP